MVSSKDGEDMTASIVYSRNLSLDKRHRCLSFIDPLVQDAGDTEIDTSS